jgi:hydrogenase maturation protease
MKKSDSKALVIGIGNNGRQDDGLGWAFLDFLDSKTTDFDLEYRYQLQIEDAELICSYDRVIFVDATKEQIANGFYFKACLPDEKYNFSTHALTPETIVYLTKALYDHKVDASILAIEGHDWDLKIGLSHKASINLEKAKNFFKETFMKSLVVEQIN